MNSKVGIWIDHEKSVIVFVSRADQELSEVTANIKKHDRQSGESSSNDRSRQDQTTEHLNKYYDEIVAMIGDTEMAFLFGPGEAKGELEKRLTHAGYKGRVDAVEPADHMTDPQIVAKVRQHYFDRSDGAYSATQSD